MATSITSPKPLITKRIGPRATGSTSNSREVTPLAGKVEPKSLEPMAAAKSDPDLATVFRSDLTNVRNLITCSICDQLLYEPWTLACGHTYCYTCLCNWFVPNRRKKTCPECRTAVKQMPAPAFLVKQIVEVFVKRSEMMPPDESIDQHQSKLAEEMAEVDRDRTGPNGLFKGAFPERRAELWLDEADGVLRCPSCGHEHEGGPTCESCGAEFDDDGYSFSDVDGDGDLDDLDDLELDLDAELALGHAQHFAMPPPHHGFPHNLFHHHLHHHHHHHDDEDESEMTDSDSSDMNDNSDDDEDEEDEGSLRDFVVQDEVQQGRPPNQELSNGPNSRQTITISDDESDEGGAVSNRRPRRAGRPATATSASAPLPVTDESSNGSEIGDHSHNAAVLRNLGWSPLEQETDSDIEGDGNTGYGAIHDDQTPEDQSDTDTMVGYRASEEDGDDRARENLSETPRYECAGFASLGGRPYAYADDDEGDDGYDSEAGLSSIMDGDGDTEMSASPEAFRASRSVSVNEEGYGYEMGDKDGASRTSRSGSVNTNEDYDYDGGEDLGVANDIHDLEGESSDSPIRGPAQRLPRQYHPNPRVQLYDPRISMMFAEHQESIRGAQNQQVGLEDWDADVRRIEPASRTRRMTAYRLMPSRRVDPLRSSRSPSATRVISSSDRTARLPRQYWRRSGNNN